MESAARRDVHQFGAILRARRRALDLTLNDVSQKTGLAKGFLSDIERDKTSPSVASLVSLCDALSLPVGDLFAPSPNVLVRAEARQPIKFGGIGVSDHLLTPSHGVKMQAIWSEIAPGGTAGDQLYSLRSEEELVLVISGDLALNIEGEEAILHQGDSLTFDPRRLHSFRNPSSSFPTIAVFIMTPPPA
ncbi:cupin domain-containing protein [Paracoccus sp. IB05]|uniref:cupin domain-containing protein n=1 Tax=Paracoccus sp. IB05 TaxID=2779367 RepID=UPI0018E72A4B|nr:cupin domain-containing protein [Paracoccus sp. IB05]MBJ2149330.1 cupin domain-containing protein [Paracoccus sp. IB05]